MAYRGVPANAALKYRRARDLESQKMSQYTLSRGMFFKMDPRLCNSSKTSMYSHYHHIYTTTTT